MEKLKKFCKEWIIPFAIEIVVILLIVKFVCFFVIVPTGSMVPTIAERSILFATRVYNPEKNVERGDILVFRSDELDMTMVKRVIGIPGDHVVIDEDGNTYLNGELYPEDYVFYKSYRTGDFTVPDGCYLFLGDNRNGSLDARSWEQPYISADKIQGKAIFTLWPFNNFGVLH
ncbi:MAG: signal peptidase I [Angelakisella sp.]|nr:signal peptidase I [Angelakisella sp.]